MAARTILKDIDEKNKQPGSAKAEILPCQSDLSARQQMAALDKELCRQRKCGENTVQSYSFKIKEQKWQLQQSQLLTPLSSSFKYFLLCIHTLSTSDRNYFLQSLKFGLNKRSVEQLQPLYEEYEKLRAVDESEERDKRLKEVDKQLAHGSLGIEHFFRELAILHENAWALCSRVASNDEQKVACTTLEEILESLADSMAGALMDGTALEVMDGDAVHVPVEWLGAVLKRCEKSESKVLKVSVLGAQSCGKSTLLNTVFGLNFPVSSGRCTRGAYMQLVKVDKNLKKTLKCDNVAVIDSEGLMSRSKTDDTDYDNERSTFIIGLSDLTLVIIKGEGNEMNDVLPLAIHVFLHMNIVGEKQACHFVHQNMGAVDAMTKVATEIDAFVQDLNAKTLAAAKDTNQSDQYKKFTDILQYDSKHDNTYVPGLLDGIPPMGKTNAYYSKTMLQLKSHILTTATKMQTQRCWGFSTFNDFSKRLDEVWEAIKHENFVLSFKNVLAVEAHKKLTKIFEEEQWNTKREIRKMLQKELHMIENEVKEGNSSRTPKQMTSCSLNKLAMILSERVAQIDDKIMHYFKCAGCKECNEDVRNRYLLANNEKEFQDDIRNVEKTITREMEQTLEDMEIKMTTDEQFNNLSAKMDEILTKKVHEAIASRKSRDDSEQTTEMMFSALWEEATRDIYALKCTEKDPRIEGIVQKVIKEILGTDDQFYRQKRVVMSPCRGRRNLTTFIVDPDGHMQRRVFFEGVKRAFRFAAFKKEDINRLQIESNRIIEETAKYYEDTWSPDGKQFSRKDVEMLFKDVKEKIDNINDSKFKITDKYQLCLIYHIEKLAVAGFTRLHDKYCKANNREGLLRMKKKSYHDIFTIMMGQGDAAAKFCETVLKDIIVKNIENQLSCTELLHDLRVHCGEIVRDMRSLQAHIMVDLFRKNSYQEFLIYITNYEYYVKCEMHKESIRHFSKKDRLKILGKTKLDQVINKIQEAVKETVGTEGHFMKIFFKKIDSLKISHNGTAAYRKLDVGDREGFSDIVHQQLNRRVREDILKDIDSWNVTEKLAEKNLTEFLFDEVVGCTAKCPFCKVPCDSHSGGRTSGNHSSTLHRPKGLGGFGWENTNKLVSTDCSWSLHAGVRFRNSLTNGEWHPYKDYHKIYPDWTIHGEADPDVEKYWKWVFAQHNEKFAEYYSCEPAELPSEWGQYTTNDIKKDIEDNYHVKVDVSKLSAEKTAAFGKNSKSLRYLLGSYTK